MITQKIEEWTSEEKNALLNAILEVYNLPYIDIHVAGSRVWGAHHGSSDIDIIIWVAEQNIKYSLSKFSFQGIRVSAKVETQPENGTLHRLAYVGSPQKPEGRDLPTYSLLSNRLFYSTENYMADVEWHINFRKGIGVAH